MTDPQAHTGALHFTNAEFQKTLDDAGDKPVLVDFFAEWCGPCQMAAPVIDKLADEMKDSIVIGKVDVDEERELAMKYQVMSIPTVVIIKKGEVVSKQVGFPGEAGYRKMITDAIGA